MNRLQRAVATLVVAIGAATLVACSAPTPASFPVTTADASVSTAERQALAPTGVLRVGLYPGSPSSIVQSRAGDGNQPRGVGYDLGRALAQRLGVPFEPVVLANNAAVLAAVRNAAVDVTFTNASPERAREMDFSPTFLDVEKSFLVPAETTLRTLDDLKRSGVRVGVSEGSSTAQELASAYPSALLVPTPGLQIAIESLRAGRIDAFATNKAILYEMSDALPGSTVISGRWGMEHFAAGVPRGRERGHAALTRFIADVQRDGTVERAVARAGLRGTVAPVVLR